MGLRQSLRRIAAKISEFIVVLKKLKIRSVDAKFVCHCIGGACFYATSETDDVKVSSIVIKS